MPMVLSPTTAVSTWHRSDSQHDPVVGRGRDFYHPHFCNKKAGKTTIENTEHQNDQINTALQDQRRHSSWRLQRFCSGCYNQRVVHRLSSKQRTRGNHQNSVGMGHISLIRDKSIITIGKNHEIPGLHPFRSRPSRIQCV